MTARAPLLPRAVGNIGTVTKRKSEAEKLKRGPKQVADNDVGTWLAIEMRRRHDIMGAKSLKKIAQDVAQLTSGRLAPKTLSNRYHRVEARRRADPAFAAHLDTAVALFSDFSDPPPGMPSSPAGLVIPAELKDRDPK